MMKTWVGAVLATALAGSSAWAQENVFITNANTGTVTVADAQTYAPLPLTTSGGPNPITVGTTPTATLYDPLRKLVYVVNSASATISVIDPTLFKVTSTIDLSIPAIDGGNLGGAVISQDGRWLFVAGFQNGPKSSGVFQVDLNNPTSAGASFVAGIVTGSGALDCDVLPASAVGGSGNGPGRLYFTVQNTGVIGEINLLTPPAAAVSVPLPGGANPPTAPGRMARSPDGSFILIAASTGNGAPSSWQIIRINPLAAPEADFITLLNTGAAGDVVSDVLFPGGGGSPFAVTMLCTDDIASHLRNFNVGATGAATNLTAAPAGNFQFGNDITFDPTGQRIFVSWNGSTVNSAAYQVYDPSLAVNPVQQETSGGNGPRKFSFAPQPPPMAIDYVTQPGGINSSPFQLEIHGHGFIQGSSAARVQDGAGVLTTATSTVVLSPSVILASFPGGLGAQIFSVSVLNNDGQLSVLNNFFEGIAANPPSPPFTVSLPPLSAGYSMLSFPQYATVGDLQASLSAQLGPYNPVSFRLFMYQQGRYFELDDPNLSPSLSLMGTGIFALSRLGDTLTLTAPDVSANTPGGQRVVALSPGWNIISQPWISGLTNTMTYTSLLVSASQTLAPSTTADVSPLVTNAPFEFVGGTYVTSPGLTAGKAYWILNQTAGPVYLIFNRASVNKTTVPSGGTSLTASSPTPPAPPGGSLSDSGGGSGGGCGLLGVEVVLVVLFLRGRRRRKLAA